MAGAFARPLPLHVDVGCGKGHFCADLAAARPELNVLGIEIREQLVDEAERLVRETRVPNLRFLAASANALAADVIDELLASPHGATELASVSVQFPDPWPKRSHAKRRVVQPALVAQVAARLAPHGVVVLQSDVAAVAEEMRAAFVSHGGFVAVDVDWSDAHAHPFGGIETERERNAARRGLPVYRALLRVDRSAAGQRRG